MREIKFRAWETYPSDYAEEVGEKGSMHYTKAWPDEEVQDKRTVVISGFYHNSGWDSESFNVMQYTGLKDKNGKEIYEGDILKGNDQDEEYCIVKYTEAKFELYDITKDYETEDGWYSAYFLDKAHIQESELEVVGSIYENPELIDN